MCAMLIRRGGRVLADLAYKTYYYGSVWQVDPAHPNNPHALARAKIDAAIDAAMGDAGLNAILVQYCGPVTCTALPSDILPGDPGGQPFDESDIRRVIGALPLAGLDLGRTVINLVLPQGTSVQVLGLDEQTRPAAAPVSAGVPLDKPYFGSDLAGYHGSVPTTVNGAAVEVLYSVVVWSDGAIGIPVPGWEAWQNIAATLYHELQEARTNPDVDVAIRTGRGDLIGWNTDPMPGPDGITDNREIADLPLILCADAVHQSFAMVPVAGGMAVPIQRLWSNAAGGMVPA